MRAPTYTTKQMGLIFTLFSVAAIALFLFRPLDEWLLTFPLEAYLPFFAFVVYCALGSAIAPNIWSVLLWCIYIFVLPLARPPILQPTFTFLWHFLPLLLLLAVSLRSNPRQVQIPGQLGTSRLFWTALVISLILKVYTAQHYGLERGPIDIGTATVSGVQAILAGENPYIIPEETGPQHYIHRQHCVYPPLMLAAYVPFVSLFPTHPAIGLYLGNFIFDLISMFLLLQIFCLLFENRLAQGLLIIHAFNPIQLANLYVRGTNDIVPFTLLLAFVFAVLKNRALLAGPLIALATGIKWYPGPIAALWGLSLLQARKFREFAFLVLSILLAILVPAVPFLLKRPSEFIDDLSWEGRRPLDDWEVPLSIQHTLLGGYYPAIHVAIILLVITFAFRSLSQHRNKETFNQQFVFWITITIAAFAIFSNVFHHNYLGWFYSLLPVVLLRAASPSKHKS